MSISTVQDAFEEFERNAVRVPDSENRKAKEAHPKVREALQKALGELFDHAYLAGSYRRKTQSGHLKDLDLIVVLRDSGGTLRASARATLQLMAQAALTCDIVSNTRVKCRAVECELTGVSFWVDIVPALPDGHGGLLLAYHSEDEDADDWRPADPEGQTQACTDKNAATGGVYVPVVRIAKFWNQGFGEDSKPLPSYMVEALMFDGIDSPCEWADATLAFFARAEHHLGLAWPSLPCPGRTGAFVDEKLEDDRRRRALMLVEQALPAVRAAVSLTVPLEAMDAWAAVFGQAFPAPSTDDALVAGALRSGTAVAVGRGISRRTGTGSERLVIPGRSHGPGRNGR